MKIGLISSTFLYPNNNCWKDLKFYKKFFEVGDFNVSEKKTKFDLIIFIIFLKDFSTNFLDYEPLINEIKKK